MKYLLTILALAAAATSAPHRNVRIFGGQNATSGQFPFIVALNDPDQFCDGSIISTSWIVTAAHCIVDLSIDNTTVLAGTHIEHVGGVEYTIAKVVVHEDYYPNTTENDIGLIQIDGELEYSDTIQPIELGDPEVNGTCVALGWGITDTVDFPDAVQYVELTSIDIDYCLSLSKDYIDGYYLGPKQVCTLGPEGKGLCYGDSGGPLVCDGKLAGVVSYGVVPCAMGYPDVFTKATEYADWIQSIIGN